MAITMKPALLLFFALSCVTYSGFVSKTDLLETARQKPGGLDEDYIVYFLSQKHAADPRVCDPDMGLIKKSRSKLITGIIKSFEKQKIDGEVFVKCLTALTRELSPGDEETLQEDIQDLLESMLTDKMGGEGELNNFVSLNRYIFSMPQRFDLHAALKLAVDHPSRDPRVQEALKDFVESSEIYKGFYQKQKLDVTAIQNLKDSRILKKVLAIHPEGSIRKQARAQFVSLQVDESKHPLIVRNRQMAKDKILDKGYYAVEINDIESLLPKKDQTLELANLWIRAGKGLAHFT